MIQRNLFILCLFFLTISCKKSNEYSEEIKNSTEVKTAENNFIPKFGKKFFEYDEIEFYHNKIDEDSAYSISDVPKSKIDRLKNELILGESPKKITEPNFTNNLEKIGFEKKLVDKAKFEEINKIFVEKTVIQAIDNACVPIYRDILVFKKSQKITGIAKICFTCDQNLIIGTKANTENFGQDGDYEKLKNLLNN